MKIIATPETRPYLPHIESSLSVPVLFSEEDPENAHLWITTSRRFSRWKQEGKSSIEGKVFLLVEEGDLSLTEDENVIDFSFLSSPLEEKLSRIRRALKKLPGEIRGSISLEKKRLEELNLIGIALGSQRDLQKLLEMIVQKARELTSADGGSLYIVDRDERGELTGTMTFHVAQNDSIHTDFHAFRMEVDPGSIAGYTALSGEVVNILDAYTIPPDSPYKFNRSFDERTGYRSKSMLVVPLKNQKGKVIGVLQLINKKKDFFRKLLSTSDVEEVVIPFTKEDEFLLLNLGGQAAVAIENAQLYEDIHRLFESFIRASVEAIESRDPTTAGHSERVAELTTSLAEVVDRIDSGPLAPVRFTKEQIRELKYASLLHDFGKIGVREQVLVKAKKLYPEQMKDIEGRFRLMEKVLKLRYAYEAIQIYDKYPKHSARKKVKEVKKFVEEELKKLSQYYQLILRANEPTILPEEVAKELDELLHIKLPDPEGEEIPLLLPDEYWNLKIPRGSLNEEERKEIESHVIHTYRFLSLIPWTGELKGIPEIAFGHHEKLDGSGYPRKAKAPEIPIQTRMMTISDIYDALTAADRPYKKALPPEKALDVLSMEVKEGKLDPLLFQVFVEAEIWKKVAKKK